MSFYFDRDDVSLPGFKKYFKACSDHYREKAEDLMKYVNMRGGRVQLMDISRPIKDEWATGLDSLEVSLELKKKINQSLFDLHSVATKYDDGNLTDILESDFMRAQIEKIKEVGDLIAKLKRVGQVGLGEYIFDKDLEMTEF